MSNIRKAIFIVTFASLLCVGLTTAADAAFGLTKYFVKLYNVDDEARLYVNGKLVLTKYFNQSEEIDISDYLGTLDTELTLKVINNGQGWTYGWEILRDDGLFTFAYTIYNHQCGSVGIIGCENDNQNSGAVFIDRFTIKWENRG